MIDQLCQAYHWSFQEAMRLTMPQIIMLGHAAGVNAKRMGLDKTGKEEDYTESTTVVVNGKKKNFDEMDSDDFKSYYSDWR